MALDARRDADDPVGPDGADRVPACPAGARLRRPRLVRRVRPRPGRPELGRRRPSPPPDCVVCGAPLNGRFCERCGHDSGRLRRAATWQAVVRARPRPGSRRSAGRTAPTPPRWSSRATPPTPVLPLSGERWRSAGTAAAAARRPRSTSPAWTRASRPRTRCWSPGPTAAGTWSTRLHERHHARRRRRPDPAHVPVPLADGSVVRLGAWTTITVSAGSVAVAGRRGQRDGVQRAAQPPPVARGEAAVVPAALEQGVDEPHQIRVRRAASRRRTTSGPAPGRRPRSAGPARPAPPG